jgi:type VII secretion protein EccB
MQTKRDQVQAHNFVVGRLKSALLRGDADAPDTPTRRFSAAGFAGFLIGAILVAGCGIVGLMFPGGDRTWREPGAIIVEKETGTRYLYVDGALRPVLNLASARLLAGAGAPVKTVSAKSLVDVPHGLPIGIPGAPDSLPDPTRLIRDPWLVCSVRVPDGPAGDRPGITVVIGHTATAVLANDVAVPLVTPDGSTHLAWRNRRLRVAGATALVAFGYRDIRPLAVLAAWLNAVPQGPDLAAPAIAGLGQDGPRVADTPTRVGQVLAVQTTTGTRDFYVVMPDGLAGVPPAAAGLLLADPASKVAYGTAPVRAVDVAADAVVAAPVSQTPLVWSGLPAAPPTAQIPSAEEGESLCARLDFDGNTPSVTLAVARLGSQATAAPPPQGASTLTADRIAIGPGRGLLARSQPSAGVAGGTLYLVTDLGVKYPLRSAEVAALLGYDKAMALNVPAMMLAFLPTGPVLDPSAAGAAYVAG